MAKNMPVPLKKYVDYLHNVHGIIEIDKFDEDWMPVGPQIRVQLRELNLAIQIDNRIMLPEVVN